jgi:N-acyl-D-amino-acid deacylase
VNFDRIREQVEQDLLDLALVGDDLADLRVDVQRERDAVSRRALPHQRQRGVQRDRQAERPEVELHATRFDLREHQRPQVTEQLVRVEAHAHVLHGTWPTPRLHRARGVAKNSSQPPAGSASECKLRRRQHRRRPSMLDIKIEGGLIIDGTGAPARRADVGIVGDSISAIGDLSREPAGRTIPASGLTVTPGFIDMHSHSDWRLWGNRRAESKIRQGVTTEVIGNCGFSPAPVSDEFRDDMKGFALYLQPGMDFSWRSMGEYLQRYRDGGVALNIAHLVGHGTLRLAAMGFARRVPTARELITMERLMDQAMAEGAYGLATGLIYAPGSYADTEEIIAIARRAGAHRGFYASHIRGEGPTLLDAVSEAIRVGREGQLGVQVSHIKAAGRPNWGKVKDALALIDAARADGLDVMADVYPYTASSTSLRTLLPDWVLEGGIDAMLARLGDASVRARIRHDLMGSSAILTRGIGWEDIMVAYTPSRPDAEGRRLSEIAAASSQDPLDAAIELIGAEHGKGSMILFQLDEADLHRALRHPHVMIGSDGSSLATEGEMAAGKPHPRSYGTFPRVLGRYAREQRLLSLEDAVKKMTGLPATRLGLRDRGLLAAGAKADVVALDADRVQDLATYERPHQYATGIDYVLVNGRVVIDRGEHTGALPGEVLSPA